MRDENWVRGLTELDSPVHKSVFPHKKWARGCLWKGILKLCGTAVAERGMKPPAVVEHFNVLKDRLMGLLVSFVSGVVDQHTLE
jgi:hypothetical protein